MPRALVVSGIELALRELQDEFPGVRVTIAIRSLTESLCYLYPPGDFASERVAEAKAISASAAIRRATDLYREWDRKHHAKQT